MADPTRTRDALPTHGRQGVAECHRQAAL